MAVVSVLVYVVVTIYAVIGVDLGVAVVVVAIYSINTMEHHHFNMTVTILQQVLEIV